MNPYQSPLTDSQEHPRFEWISFFDFITSFVGPPIFLVLFWPFAILMFIPFDFFEKHSSLKVYLAWTTLLLSMVMWPVEIIWIYEWIKQ